MLTETDDILRYVSKQIDTRQLRFSELLLVLSSGTIGLISAFLLQRNQSRPLNTSLVVALILLAISVALAFGYMVLEILELRMFSTAGKSEADRGIALDHFYGKKKWTSGFGSLFLVLQSLLFITGEVFLFVSVL